MSTTTLVSTYSPPQRQRVLSIARAVLLEVLSYRDPADPRIDDHEGYLLETRGCFVSLHHRGGALRGCIGTFEPDRPLGRLVARMAAAATRDPRFSFANPVVLAEYHDLHLEVSVLTPMQRVEDPLAMRIGIDGICIRGTAGGRRVSGCFLPQVAAEQRWDAAQTLSYCCEHKMGLPPEIWRGGGSGGELEFYIFQSAIISEACDA